LHRTDVNNEDFKKEGSEGRNALFNILNAYSHMDRNVGYV